jgi:hypothetical protein
MEENHEIIFLYVRRNTFIGISNFQIIQNELEGGYDPLFTGSYPKETTTS